LSLALAGCATRTIERQAVPARPARAVTLEQALDAYDGYCEGLHSISASGDLDVKDLRAGKQRKVGVRLLATRGDRLYLKGQVLVLTALEIVSNGERFWFQIPSKKKVWTGPVSGMAPAAEGADRAPYYALRPRDVTSAVLPEALNPGAEDSLFLETDRSLACLSLARAGLLRRRACLERETLRPARLRTYDERGELVSDVELSAWSEAGPRRVVISRPAEGYVVEFRLDKLETNKPVPERTFEPRPAQGYETVEVGG
jgi:outer membrane lipoprotein-sorting protein